jgi:hypothetical protein
MRPAKTHGLLLPHLVLRVSEKEKKESENENEKEGV